ncbi:MAG: efflux RND transporter periplasmic adaptor subunit [Candidatus Wallbacteria bacterium]|nr:efflux RND transporter periplasmic adaptor subunit [Candidatus Wallbacteria bacterium]
MSTENSQIRPDAGTPRGVLSKIIWGLRVLNTRLRFIYLMVATGLIVGYWDTIMNYYDRWTRPVVTPDALAGQESIEYFCPMHTNVVRSEPGKCPICGMPLSKRKKGTEVKLPEGILNRVQLAPYRVRQGGLATAAVEHRLLTKQIRTVGTVEYDERRLAKITARIGGRIDRLQVDFTGTVVKAGQTLASLYSPELVSTQEEYLLAIRGAGGVPLAGAARRRLLLWGITGSQLDAIARAGKAQMHLEILSPIAGTVIDRKVLEGQYVETGMELYEVADLTNVWLYAAMYEDDIAWLKLGQAVEVTTEAYPGQIFVGTVSFLHPILDRETRTLRARIDIPNPDGRLRPGMYANATLRIPVGRMYELDTPQGREALQARTAAASLDLDIYTCPMHPEITADKPGSCPKCGMNLEKTKRPAPRFTCPMHPEVVSDKPGQCPKCGMNLEPAAAAAPAGRFGLICSLHPDVEPDASGYCSKCGGRMQIPGVAPSAVAGFCCPVHPDELRKSGGACPICRTQCRAMVIEKVLAVPDEAVIDTGTRKVVYLDKGSGIYDAVEVVLGPHTDIYYPIEKGLEAGSKVVTAGSFLVDAEARLSPAAGAAYFGAAAGPKRQEDSSATVAPQQQGNKPDRPEAEQEAGSAHSGSAHSSSSRPTTGSGDGR